MNPANAFQNPIQIGIIVKDLDTLLANLKDILNVDNFRIASFPPEGADAPVRKYHGKDGDFSAKFCFYNWGNIELEVIQPISGDSVWFDYLKTTPNAMGIHHIKFMVDTHEETDAHFAEKGIMEITSGEGVGPNAGRTWKFFDTYDKLGFDVEMLNEIVTKKEEE